MAKKIRKESATQARSPKKRVSNMSLFILLLIPWIVMGVTAIVLAGTNMPDYEIILISLFVALVSTFFIGRYVRQKRPMRR